MWLFKLINVPITTSGIEPRWADWKLEVFVVDAKLTLKLWIVAIL